MKCPKCHFDNPETSRFCADCGTQIISSDEISAPTETLETPKEELITGSTFAGRYQIIEELGKGGMGKVYRVKDEKLDEEMALKILKPEIAKPSVTKLKELGLDNITLELWPRWKPLRDVNALTGFEREMCYLPGI